MTTTPVPPAAPLTEADFRAFHQAEKQHRAIKRAARIAAFDAVTMLGFAVISAIITIFYFGFWSATVTVALAVIGGVEFHGHQRLLRLDPAACRTLALNQLALLALITVYCLCQMITYAPSPDVASLPAEFQGFFGPKLAYCFYLLVILGSALFQGGLARYYYTRRRQVEALLHDTPDWIRRQLLELDR